MGTHPPVESDSGRRTHTLTEDLHDHALDPVPADRRKTLLQLIIVQIGWNISVSSFLVGGVVGGGTSFAEGGSSGRSRRRSRV
jgi:cytosine permease